MGLYLITGIAGVGKTTTIESLRKRGYEAYDIDYDGYAHWQQKSTGASAGNDVPSSERTPEFQQNHDWYIYGDKVIELANRAADKTIFLGGVADGLDAYYSYFSHLFYLNTSKETIGDRLRSRYGEAYGKSKHEFDATMEWYGKSQDLARAARMTFIDATLPNDIVVDQILEITEKPENP